MAEGFVWPLRKQMRAGSACPIINPQETLADSETSAALIYGGRQSSPEPAAAGACRLNLPGGSGCVQAQPARRQRASAAPIINPQEILADSETSAAPIYGGR